MKNPEVIGQTIGDIYWSVEHGDMQGAVKHLKAVQLDAFKAGAEWAAKQHELGDSVHSMETRILSASSNLKEIPK